MYTPELTKEEVEALLGKWGPAPATVQAAESAKAKLRSALESEGDPVTELVAALKECIEFADEGWAYASDYFREKWDYEGQRTKAIDALARIAKDRQSEETA